MYLRADTVDFKKDLYCKLVDYLSSREDFVGYVTVNLRVINPGHRNPSAFVHDGILQPSRSSADWGADSLRSTSLPWSKGWVVFRSFLKRGYPDRRVTSCRFYSSSTSLVSMAKMSKMAIIAIEEVLMSTRVLPLIPGHPMESISSTETQNSFGKVLGRVLRGAVVGITRHDEVSAVLLSAETYEALLAQRSEPLEELRDQFDRRFAAMQTPRSKAGIHALFEATPQELGRAAMNGAKKRG